ncbi:MAG: hypothetical protein Q9M91_05550 [Candidatus Dojkabacteria bacterium]|nr:hypothetical protein [Candidatus Dojkabacteria bacterium]
MFLKIEVLQNIKIYLKSGECSNIDANSSGDIDLVDLTNMLNRYGDTI